MMKVLAFLKSCFDVLKSWLDYSAKRNEARSKTTGKNADRMKDSDRDTNEQERTPERKPWIVISNGKIEVFKD